MRFAGIFLAIFCMGGLPLLLVQPVGANGVGLSAGFFAPISHAPHLLVIFLVGVWAAYLGRNAMVMLPVCFVIMLAMSGFLEVDAIRYPKIKFFLLGGMLLFAYAVSAGFSRAFIASVAITSSIAFHLGALYQQAIPDYASPLYYITGELLAVVLLMCSGVSLGVICRQPMEEAMARFKSMPAISTLLSFF